MYTDTVVPVHTLKAYRGSRDTTPLILILWARWSEEVNFTFRPLYPAK